MMSQITKSAEPTNSTPALERVLVVEDDPSEVVVLTEQEFKALQFLVLNPDCVIGRDELLKGVWGYQIILPLAPWTIVFSDFARNWSAISQGPYTSARARDGLPSSSTEVLVSWS
jgi:hypothetical protein